MLTIIPDKVRQVADKYPQAVEALKELFPEAFDVAVSTENVVMKEFPFAAGFVLTEKGTNCDLIIMYAPQQGFKGFVLNNTFEWKMEKLNGSLQLIPSRK